jgi:acyl dehydratase
MGVSYEDLEVGRSYEVGSHTFGRDEIVQFAQQFDPQPFHLSEAAGEASMFGGLVASGWHTCSVMMGMLVRGFLKDSTSMGSPGLDEVRWIKPMRVGDTLTMTNTIVSKRVSASKPDRGIVETRWEGRNQHGETVVTVSSKALFGLRHPGVRHQGEAA